MVRDELMRVLGGRATGRYGLSAVNQLQHALQAGALAEARGEPATLIVACLLHDIGHMVHDIGEDYAERGIDDKHEERGADWLARHFGPAVSEPVHLHVAAKRYLHTVDATYVNHLSPESIRSLGFQGGPMSPAEIAAFEKTPYAAEAVRLRRIDDEAKDPKAATPAFEHFLTYVDLAAADRPPPRG